MYSWWWVELSPETCRVKPLRRINAIVASCWIYFTIQIMYPSFHELRISALDTHEIYVFVKPSGLKVTKICWDNSKRWCWWGCLKLRKCKYKDPGQKFCTSSFIRYIKSRENEIERACGRYGGRETCVFDFGWKSRKKETERSRRRWKNSLQL